MPQVQPQVQDVTDATFRREIEEHAGLALVDFWADWCGPCRMMAPVVEQLAAEYAGRVKVAKLDTEAHRATAARFGIRSIPSFLLFRDGALVETIVGAVPKGRLAAAVEQHR